MSPLDCLVPCSPEPDKVDMAMVVWSTSSKIPSRAPCSMPLSFINPGNLRLGSRAKSTWRLLLKSILTSCTSCLEICSVSMNPFKHSNKCFSTHSAISVTNLTIQIAAGSDAKSCEKLFVSKVQRTKDPRTLHPLPCWPPRQKCSQSGPSQSVF